ncbi:hypothetical protein CGMCC3_g3207 [Colletotrichum fructicola]|uniref:N-acetylglucosamine-induced protein 1 n=1 Tax=Colletotrichum fructicola (strain Nara gc5) TaxID=1213859 RepID=A0A7J6JMY7_COLFN|nr:uncharacterized protein CGMCC3_g3207 [Colletotrichum fructicola]KAE9581090.1 hypothetical protein CGMCC3_g3207 [Colletotrichum fructicola]KAF4428077.1 N-acetylglucosamine-induced protein 1 [Colletotrichum fructicola]KAF4491939.1 N-acetylglucosamine-induced protein 1 [Colletotrichum fructicola Nara gc5]KAF4887408.1 N-acetylglucosamine-induced protein 1 [Colletotrichum fructicola]
MGSLYKSPALPYWQVNVPPEHRTEECPEGLRNLSAKDVGILSTPDAEYVPQSWETVRRFVATNRLDLFQRVPSELRRYRLFIHQLIQEHGSVMNFVLRRRLGWEEPLVSQGKPFELDKDLKILVNDWPYGIDERIVHLVVWTKFELEEDLATGDLTEVARGEIEAYVDRTFRSRTKPDSVIWFKNWRSLKSVHAVEHFHVMLFDPDAEFIKDITNGDVPQCEKFRAW